MIYIKHQMFNVFKNWKTGGDIMNTAELKQMADHLRMVAVDMVYKGKDGHPGPALSIADLMSVLFCLIQRSCVPDLLCGTVRERLFWRESRRF